MTPREALDAPSLLAPTTRIDPESGLPRNVVQIISGEFPDAMLEEAALPIEAIEAAECRFVQNLGVGIARDPESTELKAGSHYCTNSRAFAY